MVHRQLSQVQLKLLESILLLIIDLFYSFLHYVTLKLGHVNVIALASLNNVIYYLPQAEFVPRRVIYAAGYMLFLHRGTHLP